MIARTRRQRRNGAFVIGVIIVLFVVAAFVMAFTRSLISQRRLARTHHQHRQAYWLAESGLSRGTAQLSANPNYDGETWTVSTEMLNGQGEVVIDVLPADEETAVRRLRARARYPLDSKTPVTVEATLPLSPSSSGDES